MKKLLLATFFSLFSLTFVLGQSDWNVLNSGTKTALYSCDFLDENTGMAVGENGLILKTTNGGVTWDSLDAGITTTLNAVNYMDANNIFIVGYDGLIAKTNDGGDTWSHNYMQGISGSALFCIDMTEMGIGVIGGQHETILTTNDGGQSWGTVQTDRVGCFYATRIYDEDNAFFFGENAIFESFITKLEKLSNISLVKRHRIWNGDYFTEGKLFDGYVLSSDSIITVGCNISPTADMYESFVTRNQDLNEMEWYPVYTVDSAYYLAIDLLNQHGLSVGGRIPGGRGGTEGTLYLISETFDQGISWSDVESPVTGCILYDVEVLNTVSYIVGDSGLIMKSAAPTVTHGNMVNFDIKIYPNPSIGSCKLSFHNDCQQLVTITLYSSEGKYISTIKSGFLNSGNYDIEVPVENLPNGLYYITLSSPNGYKTGKLNLIN